MGNRTTLAQLDGMIAGDVASLPLDHIEMLLEDLAAENATNAKRSGILSGEIARRFAEQATAERKKAGKDTGTVRVRHGEYVCVADLPKKVEWNQAELRKAIVTLRDEWEENPDEYVTTVLSVPEKNYTAWPKKIQKLFEPARTLGTGKPTYKLELAKAEVA